MDDVELEYDLFHSSFSEVFLEEVVVELVGFAIGFVFNWWFSFFGLSAEDEKVALKGAEVFGLVVEVVTEDSVAVVVLVEGKVEELVAFAAVLAAVAEDGVESAVELAFSC